MENYVSLLGPERSLNILGVRLMGLNAETARKIGITLLVVFVVLAVSSLLKLALNIALSINTAPKFKFWFRQFIKIVTALLILVGVCSIWFDDPGRLTTAFGIMSAGLAFALQKVITSFAGYIVILRGKMFNVGDRISIGGVRGDVVSLDFTQTTLMEMGTPPPSLPSESGNWVQSRQFTGRIVRVTNSKIFDEPVFNYTRDFPYIWEEMNIPITYAADRARAEQILLDAVTRNTVRIESMGERALKVLEERFFMRDADVHPKVYYRITDNWLELSVRFLVRDHGVRDVKDKITRDILVGLDSAEIAIASATYDIVGFPTLRINRE